MPNNFAHQFTSIKSLIHISPGSIPSQYAHSMQIMKAAEAISKKVKDFELITSGDIVSALTGKNPDFREWYGLHHQFRIIRIPTYFKKKPFTTHYCGRKLYYLLAALYAKIKSPTLIHMRSLAGIEIILKKTNLPLIWEHHDLLPEAFFRNIVKNRNLIGFVSTTPELAEIAIKGGMSPEKILIEKNAVDLENFLPYHTKPQARSNIGITESSPIVIYVGHLYDKKGIPTLLDIAALMPSCKFILVGGWKDDVERVREICRKRKLDNIKSIGHVVQSKLYDYFYAADILIMPTSDHINHTLMGSQLKIFEYMASRRPFVASALPSIKSVLRDGVNALLAEPGNAQSFKYATEKLINDRELSDRLTQQAYEDVQYYTWDIRAERILKFAEEKLSAFYTS